MFTVREVADSDFRNLNQLLQEIDSESYNMLYDPGERMTSDADQAAFIERVRTNPRSTFIIADNGYQLMGFIAIVGQGQAKRLHSRYIAMGVLSKFHRMKVGSALMEAAIEFCRSQEVTRIELTVITTNLPAIGLYQKYGFEVEGNKRQSLTIEGHPVDEYYMSRIE